MSFSHGRHTFISLDGDDLSAYTKNSTLSREADAHDMTHYGAEAHEYDGGLKNGTAGMDGTYDNTAAGPRAIIEPLVGTVVSLVRRPDGTGSGKAQDVVDVLVQSYVETNPVADFVQWSAQLQLSGPITTTAQA